MKEVLKPVFRETKDPFDIAVLLARKVWPTDTGEAS